MKTLFVTTALLALASTAFGDPDRSHNSGPVDATFPKSLAPKLHPAMVKALAGQTPFDDKVVKKVAVTSEWGAWYREGGIAQQQMVGSVGVFDPQNKKCWVWKVAFFHQSAGPKIYFDYVTGQTVHEIACAKLS